MFCHMDFANTLRVVTPTLDGDVLRVVSQADKAFTGREIQRLIGHASPEGVRLALRRLVDQGVVEAEPAGRATLYQFNRDHLAAEHILALATLRSELIGRLGSVFAVWAPAPTVAALFGSVARGDADAQSDVDLLLVWPGGTDEAEDAWRSHVTRLESTVEAWTGNSARTLEYSEAEFRSLRGQERVVDEAIREGIVLFGSFPAAGGTT